MSGQSIFQPERPVSIPSCSLLPPLRLYEEQRSRKVHSFVRYALIAHRGFAGAEERETGIVHVCIHEIRQFEYAVVQYEATLQRVSRRLYPVTSEMEECN